MDPLVKPGFSERVIFKLEEWGRRFLFEHVPRGGVVAEIGVHIGEFSKQILDRSAPAQLHLIDPWKYETDEAYEKAWYGGAAAGQQAQLDARYAYVLERFAGPIADGVVTVHRCPSAEAARTFDDELFDWIYIDGNHFYDFVKQDLELYLPKVKQGGLLVGDDYGRGAWWGDGVKRAVDELIAGGGVEVVAIKNRQFVLRRLSGSAG